jgi:ABC-type arginine transport system permease subunit
MLSKLKTEPALVLGLVGALVAAITQILEAANAGGTFNVWTAVVVGVPLVVGVLVRFNVVAAETVRQILNRADTGLEAAKAINDRVKAELPPVDVTTTST